MCVLPIYTSHASANGVEKCWVEICSSLRTVCVGSRLSNSSSFSTIPVGVSGSIIERSASIVPTSIATKLSRCVQVPSARSEEHTSELQSLMRISYAVFCLKKKKQRNYNDDISRHHKLR